MSLESFHPAVARWFAGRFAEPTAPQRRAWPVIQSGRDALIAAPTGSGKTFAAFLAAIDSLVRQGLSAPLPDAVQVLYVSPLKALSNDVHKNLTEPLEEIRHELKQQGLPDPEIRVLLRTGDTPMAERQAMIKQPPHILVTTPESLYLLLTSERAREMLKSVRTVIVDEIHAVARDKRGSHLALSLERLEALTRRPPQRIGLSATQKPIELVARFLGGARPLCEIIDEGHRRRIDLALEIPSSPLEAVTAAEVWEEINDRLAQLINEHGTTLVFVNTRRLAERLTMQLSERLGADQVTSHHGSLSKEKRLDAETRLKEGKLKALVATASLELGIDIGSVDLVCQLSTPRSIAALLQRVGRSGHRLQATPKGRLFPLTRDDLVECTALIRAANAGMLDHLIIPEHPLDILAQQIVAAVACEEWAEDALYAMVCRAYPYRNLERRAFDDVVQMLADGFTTRRGRRGAYIHYDGVNRRLRARRAARLTAITSGGAIPDLGDYRVILEPTETFVGTLNEDFAIESSPGDVFQLGNASYLILRVEAGQVRVADAQGQPPSVPFWLGEAPARTDELSAEVSRLRAEVTERLPDVPAAIAWLEQETGIAEPAARQLAEYLEATRKILGVVPTQDTLVLERFFDEAGGMQLVLHAPFGARINKAWGLALRKRFCRSFNFELQAAATDDCIVLSLGPHHSFPLDSVFQFLNTATLREILIQAMLVAPMFQSRWRWNATRALAVPRFRGGRRVPTPLQRMEAEDLSAAVFPDQLACPENLVGDREIPDHPLIRQTIEDCLTEAMDLDGLIRIIDEINAGKHTLVARDTTEPSPICHEVITAKPYAFLDDAPLEERRTQAVITRRGLDVKTAEEFGKLDTAAIERVREEAQPEAENADELHDALLVMGAAPSAECEMRNAKWPGWFQDLVRVGRAAAVGSERALWVATERVPMALAAYPGASCEPPVSVPEREAAKVWTREDAIRELVRGRLEIAGPTTAREIGEILGLPEPDVEFGLAALEQEGFVLRGRFTPGVAANEWCERRLLARIHRYTLDRLRREIEPVPAADFLRFLFRWQRLTDDTRASGPEGLAAVLDTLDGFELGAGAWESDILPSRVAEYDPLWLDGLCLSGEVAWGRLLQVRNAKLEVRNRKAGPIRATPIALYRRERGEIWRAIGEEADPAELPLSHAGRAVFEALHQRGASFFGDLVNATGKLRTEVEQALGELVAWGLVVSDSFAGLRALLVPSDRRRPIGTYRRRGPVAPFGVETAGRWSLVGRRSLLPADQVAEAVAWMLLRRYGVVFRRLLERETLLVPWRDVLRVYRRLEARGEIRGGRFVAGFSGEQYAMPEAIGTLRAVRKERTASGERGIGELIAVSGADPLNLVGILTPGDLVPAVATNRILYRDGVPVAVKQGEGRGEKFLVTASLEEQHIMRAALVRRRPAPLVRTYLGKSRAGARGR